MRLVPLLIFVFVLLATGARADAPVVIVLSWDGTRHDFPETADTPALDRMQREGVRAQRLVPPFPPNTFPSHVTLATGAPVDVHGIVGNRFTDRERGRFSYSNDASWILAEPIWVTAERQDVRAATFFWVGSETDWHGLGATYREAPFDGALPESAKVDRMLEWLDLPEPERPGLILSWWHGCDDVAHREGPDHRDVSQRLAEQDLQLARLIAGIDARGLWPHTTLLVVSDHGMTAARRSIEVERELASAGIEARLEAGGGTGYLHLADPNQRARARELLAALPGLRAFPGDELPAELRAWRPERSGDLVLLAEPPWTLSRVSGYRGWRRWLRWFARPLAGMHGYLPDHPDMGAIFYAMGRGVTPGRDPGRVRAIDLAPTIAALLGIDPPRQSEGRAILDWEASPTGDASGRPDPAALGAAGEPVEWPPPQPGQGISPRLWQY